MKAITCVRYGPPEVLNIADVKKPEPKPNEIRINVRSVSVTAGDCRVLINGASGSVGTFGVQIAKHLGATVTAVTSTRNKQLVESIGADHHIDYTKVDPLSGTETYDAIFDAVGTLDIKKSIDKLNPGGVLLHAVATPTVVRKMRRARKGTQKRTVGAGPNSEPGHLETLKKMIESGALKTIIDQTYRMDEIVDAHRYADTGRKRGNLVITIST